MSTFVAGDDVVLEITATDSDGDAVDITACTINFEMQRNVTDSEVVISKSTVDGITITDGTNGVMQVVLTNTDTADLSGTYYYEIKVTDLSGYIRHYRESDYTLPTITFKLALV